MDALAALSVPIRRNLLERISKTQPAPATSLGKDLDITPSAVSQHLKVLLDAGFVTVQKSGTSRLYSINFREFQKVQDWISRLGPELLQTFDRLDAALDAEEEDPE